MIFMVSKQTKANQPECKISVAEKIVYNKLGCISLPTTFSWLNNRSLRICDQCNPWADLLGGCALFKKWFLCSCHHFPPAVCLVVLLVGVFSVVKHIWCHWPQLTGPWFVHWRIAAGSQVSRIWVQWKSLNPLPSCLPHLALAPSHQHHAMLA